jgi:peptidoglycan/xylan/chitin deacetylase (PgdA/CDA1 family)
MNATTTGVGTGLGMAAAAALAAHLCPTVGVLGPVRRVWPRLSGEGRPDHVALTFDDGPDPDSTPAVADSLGELGVRATFFVLGEEMLRLPSVGRRLIHEGHELAVHGWDHRCLAWRTPRATRLDLLRCRELLTSCTGRTPRWFRPAYGVLTLAALRAARELELTPLWWSRWGRDWTAGATAESIVGRLGAGRLGGSVLLLHDAPAGRAAPGAWRETLRALPMLVDRCHADGLTVGPLEDHGLDRGRHETDPPHRAC